MMEAILTVSWADFYVYEDQTVVKNIKYRPVVQEGPRREIHVIFSPPDQNFQNFQHTPVT